MTTDDKLTDEEAIKLAEWLGIEVFHLPFLDNDYVPCVKVLCGQTRPTTTYLDSAEGERALMDKLGDDETVDQIWFNPPVKGNKDYQHWEVGLQRNSKEYVQISENVKTRHPVNEATGSTRHHALQRAILRMIND